jgi:integrase
VKAGTCRVRLEPNLLPFKSATQLQYLPETSHKKWANFRGQDQFLGSRGPLTAQGLQRIWKRSVKLAGLPKELSIHSARHTIAVQLLKKTGNLRLVQKQLGHASPATTANMYADISFEDMQNGLNGLYQ